jgi:hypothetical protein
MSSADERPEVASARKPPEVTLTTHGADAADSWVVSVESDDGAVAGVLFLDEDAGQAAAADVLQSLQTESLALTPRGVE